MLLPVHRLINIPVMSLQTGSELARTHEPIIDPRQLTIVAFYVDGRSLDEHPSVLHTSDIRELSDIGMIVDDSDALMSPDGLVRLQQIIDFHFELTGIKVVDEHGRKLGKVKDYVVEPATYTIQQLYTEQSLLRSLSTMSNVIHRSQIISVTNDRITVASPTVDAKVPAAASGPSDYINPFRKSELPERQ
jgi:uncharacterized protein YrrD